jgi:hypothetical protein
MPRKATKQAQESTPIDANATAIASACAVSPVTPAYMAPEQASTAPAAPKSALDEAIEVKALVRRRLEGCDPTDMAKYVDAYSRAANVVRQLEKDRKKSLTEFTDDEVIEYVRALPERRRDALVTAVQGTSLAGKPLFG